MGRIKDLILITRLTFRSFKLSMCFILWSTPWSLTWPVIAINPHEKIEVTYVEQQNLNVIPHSFRERLAGCIVMQNPCTYSTMSCSHPNEFNYLSIFSSTDYTNCRTHMLCKQFTVGEEKARTHWNSCITFSAIA